MININTVGIIGAGTMGSALAQKFAQEGLNVVLVDMEDSFLNRGLENIKKTLKEGVDRGIFTEDKAVEILERIIPTTSLQKVAECQLIIEAVFEDRRIKEDLFRQISSIVPADTILATNTSSFSVTELSTSVSNPERFLGLHFFYHAAKNRLVEVVKGDSTSEYVFKQALWFMQKCGKDPIISRDSYGFVVNRFFVPWLNEAVRIYEEGLATKEEIDTVCCSTFGVGMGPFALMNATGVLIAYHAQKTLEDGFGPFYRPANTLKEKAESNQIWAIDELNLPVDESLVKSIADRMLGVVFLVCGQILDEGVTSATELNRGARIGLRWRLGPVDLMLKLGEKRVQTLVRDVCDKWKFPMPDSLTVDTWIFEFVKLDKFNKTAVLTITRPEDLNALNEVVFHQLGERFADAEQDEDIETIVITGLGKAFVAGADIKFFVTNLENGNFNAIRQFTELGQKVLSTIDGSSKKVVAVINGLALGGGLELALAADVIIATENAVFAFPETGIGIYPGLGGTVRTPQRIGKGLAKYLIYTGAFVNAEKAKEFGLVDEVMSFQDVMEMFYGGKPIPELQAVSLSPKWQAIEAYFETNSLKDILADKIKRQEGLSGEEVVKIQSAIMRKAPIALRVAEELIDGNGRVESELEKLETVFATEDALIGLKSVGGKSPRFKGC